MKGKKIFNRAGLVFAALLAVIVVCAASFGALVFNDSASVDAETAPVLGAQTRGGTVGLDELAEKYDVEYIAVPGGESTDANSYWQRHSELHQRFSGRVLNSSSGGGLLEISGTTLSGWNGAQSTTRRMIIVVPSNITTLSRSGTNTNRWNTNAESVQSLVGLAFEEGSALTTVSANAFEGCNNLSFAILPQRPQGNTTKNITIGNNAFNGCSTLRELVLPEGVTTIGTRAFGGLQNLAHISIPSTVTSVQANAFQQDANKPDINFALVDVENNSSAIRNSLSTLFPFAMNFYGSQVPDNIRTGSYLYTTDSVGKDGTAETRGDGLIFSYNNRRSDVLATTSGGNVNYSANRWYFVTLAGPERKQISGGTANIRYVFPEEIDFTAARTEVKWDYISSSGEKVLNNFTAGVMTEYDINKGAASSMYALHVDLSGAQKKNNVTVIGDYAFLLSHTEWLDMPASITHVGSNAFRGLPINDQSSTNQVYYMRRNGNSNPNVGRNAFAMAVAWNITNSLDTTNASARTDGIRQWIFSDKASYDAMNTSVYNSVNDGGVSYSYLVPVEVNVFDGSAWETRVVDERLAGSGNYNTTLDANGFTWTASSSDVPMPNIDETNVATVWYAADNFNSAVTRANLNTSLNNRTTEKISLYSRKFTAATVNVHAPYTYGDGELGATGVSFETALGLNANDFIVAGAEYTDFGNVSSQQSNVREAGTYNLRVQLNPNRWGVWKDEVTNNNVYTVTVNRRQIDLGNIANIPAFTSNVGGNISMLGGDAAGTTLYRYESGWFMSQQTTEGELTNSVAVTNSFARFTESQITVAPQVITDANDLRSNFRLEAMDNRNVGTVSQRYDPDFRATITNHNYIFVNTFNSDDNDFRLRGITVQMSGEENTTAVITKAWYIIQQTNYLVMDGDAGEVAFIIATRDGAAVSNWTYEDNDIDVHIPRLAYGDAQAQNSVRFTLQYNGEYITSERGEEIGGLARYINAAMPAGDYTVNISSAEFTSESGTFYPAIDDRYVLRVAPAPLDTSDIQNALTGGEFEQIYSGNVYLHDDIATLIAALDAKLNLRRAAASNSVWSGSAYDVYYGSSSLSYNLDRMQTSEYYAYESLSGFTNVPREVGEYVVYYSVSAPNYISLGGSSAADRRDYTFNTVIYSLISSNAFSISESGLHNLVYNGGVQSTSVPYSQYYSPSIQSGTNVGRYTVTITLNEPKFYRWNRQESHPVNVTFDENNAAVLYATYQITPATNSWNAAPQMRAWEFNGFNSALNTVASSLRFEDATVTYALINEGDEYIGVNGRAVNADNNVDVLYFTVGADGRVSDEKGAILNIIVPGEYRLESVVSAYANGNVTGFTTAEVAQNVVNVRRAQNYWTSTPNIRRWSWGAYNPDINIITAAAMYPDTLPQAGFTYGDDVPIIVYSITTADGSVTIPSVLNSFTEVNGDVATALGALPQGDYVLTSSLSGTAYYTDIMPVRHEFTIAAAVNYWTTTPNVAAWNWDGYTSSSSLINAVAAYSSVFGDEQAPVVKFTVLNAQFELVEGLKEFTTENGVVTDTNVADILSGLLAGDYRLVASIEARRNYSAINADAIGYDFADTAKNAALQYITFTVGRANNSWDITPRMTMFQYKGFTADTNFVAGDPHYGDGEVLYGIQSAAPTPNAAPTQNTFSNIADIAGYLNTLSVGNYYLVAYVQGADGKYYDLYRDAQFEVAQARSNDWVTEPAITGWIYGEFRSNLIVDGEATFQSEAGLLYTIQKQTDEDGNDFENCEGYVNLSVTDIRLALLDIQLNAGSYRLQVTTGETDDYVAATDEIRFTVGKTVNGWNVSPAINGWVWGATNVVAPTSGTPSCTQDIDGSTIEVIVKFYTARQDASGAWVKNEDGEVTLSNGFDASAFAAGDYIYEVTVAESTNYRELISSIHFAVSLANNSWAVDPSGSYRWVWGEAEGQLADAALAYNLANARAVNPSEGQTVVYGIYYRSNNTLVKTVERVIGVSESFDALIAELARLGVGDYTVTVEVASTANFAGVSTRAYLVVESATFGMPDALGNFGWSYDSATKTLFENPEIALAYEDDIYTASYTVTPQGESVGMVFGDYASVISALQGAGVGVYNISLTVSGSNYITKTLTGVLRVTQATFAWASGHEPSDTSWAWDAAVADKTLIVPQITDAAGNAVTDFTVTLAYGTTRVDYTNNFSGLYAWLTAADRDSRVNADTYTVTVSAQRANYVTLTKTYTVTINRAENAFTPQPADITKVYSDGALPDGVSAVVTATYGTVVYTCNTDTSAYNRGDEIPESGLESWIIGLPKGEYSYTVSVQGDDNYEGLSVTVNLHILGAGGTWDNAEYLQDSYEFAWTEQLKDNLSGIVLPIKTPPENIGGSTVFAISYHAHGSTQETNDRNLTADAVRSYFATDANLQSGVYTITAVFEPLNDRESYASLEYTITVTVGQHKTEWIEGSQPDAIYNEIEYNKFDGVSTPQTNLSSAVVTYVVTNADGEVYSGVIENLQNYLNTLDVGSYEITYEVIETLNYSGLAKVTVNVRIIRAFNGWKEGMEPKASYEFTRGSAMSISMPEPLAGFAYAVIDGNTALPFNTQQALDSYLTSSPLSAGAHTITFVVDATTNYAGIDAQTRDITVGKKENGWATEPQDASENYSFVGSADVSEFTLPEAREYNNLLRFDIVDRDNTQRSRYGLTVTAFRTAFNGLTAGTYIVTMRVGSLNANETDANIINYNADYEMLSAENTVIVSQLGNSFTVGLTDIGWNYGDKIAESADGAENVVVIAKPEAAAGNDNIVYTVNRVGGTSSTARTFNDFDAFINYLEELPFGSYNVSADIAADSGNVYSAANTHAVYTVSRAQNSWEKHVGENGAVNWTYGEAQDIEYDYVGKPPIGDAPQITVSVIGNTASSFAALKDLRAGSYTVTVTVAPSDYYEGLSETFTLNVAAMSNGWTTVGITETDEGNSVSWTYSETDNNGKISITPTHGSDGMTVTVDGGVSDLGRLTTLGYGEHRISVAVASNGEYESIEYLFTLSVSRATNGWTTQGITETDEGNSVSWTYSQTANNNAIQLTPDYGENRMRVTVNGAASAIANLATLGAGTYTVVVTVPQDDYYSELNYTFTLTVAAVENDWATKTGISDDNTVNWTYSQTENNNKIQLAPRYGAIASVTVDGTLSSLTNLTTLGFGAHTVSVYVPATDSNRYGELRLDFTLNVSRATNGWATKSGIDENNTVSWTYSETANNSTIQLTPDYGENRMRVTVNGAASAIANLATLGAGTYTVVVTVPQDDFYSEFNYTFTLTVAAIANDWATSPDMTEEDGENVIVRTCEDGGIVFTAAHNGNLLTVTVSGSVRDLAYLSTLTQGEYAVVVEVPTDGYYAGIRTEFTLRVNLAENSWTKHVTSKDADGNLVVDWVYGSDENAAIEYENAQGFAMTVTVNGSPSNLASLTTLGSGSYTVTVTAPTDGRYAALTETFTLTVAAAENTWTRHVTTKDDDDNLVVNWIYGAEDNVAIEYANAQGFAMTVTINGSPSGIENLKDLEAGDYTVTVTATGNAYYATLSETFTLKISGATNSWANGGMELLETWEWNDGSENRDIGWVAPIPRFGRTVIISVMDAHGQGFSVTLTYTDTTDGLAVYDVTERALLSRLNTLDVGHYTVTAVIPQTDSYNEYSQALNIEITQAANRWLVDPTVQGWEYANDSAMATSRARFGSQTVKYTYASQSLATDPADIAEEVWRENIPAGGGSYYVRGVIERTDNYTGLVGYGTFSITATTNIWTRNVGVINWNWNGYDRTVNLFSGSARSGTVVTFGIFINNETAVSSGDFTASFTDSQIARMSGFVLREDGMVDAELETMLKALKPNTYLLKATAAANNDFHALPGEVSFEVGKAANGWRTAPNVVSYAYGETPSITSGEPYYGDVRYRVTGTVYLNGTNADATFNERVAEENLATFLSALGAGNYTLRAWVPTAQSDTFDALYSEGAPYIVMFSVSRIDNEWKTSPSVSDNEIYYSDFMDILGDEESFAEWFSPLDVVSNNGKAEADRDEVIYSVLNGDGSSAISETFNYAGLADALKLLESGRTYRIRAFMEQLGSYNSLTADVSFTLNRYSNELRITAAGTARPLSDTDVIRGQWDKDNTTIIFNPSISADYGSVQYTLAGTTYGSFEGLSAAARLLAAANYTVTVSVAQTDEYVGDSVAVTLAIEKGVNEWLDGWTADNAIYKQMGGENVAISEWQWFDDVAWNSARTKYSDVVRIEIKRNLNDIAALNYITVDYSANDNGASAIESVGSVLSGLDRGTYYMIVTAPASPLGNWDAIESYVSFTVTQADNRWTSAPSLSATSWEYGSAAAGITADALHGDAEYSFYQAGSSVKLDGMPSAAGDYVVRFSVAATDNYAGIAEGEEISFTIEKALNDDFDVDLNVNGWVWFGYDKGNNMFSGKPNSGGSVSYTVLDESGEVLLDNILLVDRNGERQNNPDIDLYVDDDCFELLNSLTAGTYTLRINVSETVNFRDFTYTRGFEISEAVNTWSVAPQIVSWYQNAELTEDNLPKAMSLYGNPTITITSRVGSRVYYNAVYNPETESYDETVNELYLAPVGYYDMLVEVEAEEGKYGPALNETIPFQVFLRGSVDQNNFWEVEPTIADWTANLDGEYGEINGKGARGSVYFEFYTAVRNASGAYERGELITSENGTLVERGTRYFRDFYVPIADGTYYMYAHSRTIGENGEIIVEDNLDTNGVRFEIRQRINNWTLDGVPSTDVRTLYLGERDSWLSQLNIRSEAEIAGSVITYVFRDASGREYDELPATVGVYTIVVTATALYSRDLVNDTLTVNVELTPNSWKELPAIESVLYLGNKAEWAAPTAVPQEGGVVFTYRAADGTIYDEIPTEEGDYTLIATTTADYAVVLVGTVDFSVRLSVNSWIESPTIKDWSAEFEGDDPIGSALVGTEDIVYSYAKKETPDEIFYEKPTEEGEYFMYATLSVDGYETITSSYEFVVSSAYDRQLLLVDAILGAVACSFAIVVMVFAVRRHKNG